MMNFHKILCPMDFSEPSFQALLQAARLALQQGSELYVLHVLEPGEDARSGVVCDLHRLIREHLPARLSVHSQIRQGDVTTEILRAAAQENVDLIVMATHGSSGWREFALGSVADEIVRLAPCPVLTYNSMACSQAQPEAREARQALHQVPTAA